jgi:hypothetical protein
MFSKRGPQEKRKIMKAAITFAQRTIQEKAEKRSSMGITPPKNCLQIRSLLPASG